MGFWNEFSRAKGRTVFPDIASIFSHAQGSHEENESSFGLEMSQIGFSTHRLKVGQSDPSRIPSTSDSFQPLTKTPSTPGLYYIPPLTNVHPDLLISFKVTPVYPQ